MNERQHPSSQIQSVRISKLGVAGNDVAPTNVAPCRSVPIRRLGARSPFGLALPDAKPSAATMYAPRGVWLDDKQLIVSDSGNHRILIWNRVPETDETAADVVLGQPDFESEGPAARGRGAENGVHLPTGVIVAEKKLFVADAWHHRVLVWNKVPVDSNTPPDFAIGQSSLDVTEVNRGGTPTRNSLYWPYGIAYLNGRFCIADTGNRRVLIWNGIPERDQPADILLGQPSDSEKDENRGGPVTGDSFRWPHDFASVGSQFFVADAGNHRVLGWNDFPDQDRAADMVLGQKDFESAYELPYDAQGPKRLRFPYGVASSDSLLAIADTANNRILFWSVPLQEVVYSQAMDVLGQRDFASNGENHWQSVANDSLCWPYGICFHKNTLAIADSGNNRVMLWDCQSVIDSLPNESESCA